MRKDSWARGCVETGIGPVVRWAVMDFSSDEPRFRRRLHDAAKLARDARRADGAIPDYWREWPEEKRSEVAATLGDLLSWEGALAECAAHDGDLLRRCVATLEGNSRAVADVSYMCPAPGKGGLLQ